MSQGWTAPTNLSPSKIRPSTSAPNKVLTQNGARPDRRSPNKTLTHQAAANQAPQQISHLRFDSSTARPQQKAHLERIQTGRTKKWTCVLAAQQARGLREGARRCTLHRQRRKKSKKSDPTKPSPEVHQTQQLTHLSTTSTSPKVRSAQQSTHLATTKVSLHPNKKLTSMP